MNSGALFLCASLLSVSVLVLLLQRQIAAGTLERNSVMGLRTKATKASDTAWTTGHLAAGSVSVATIFTNTTTAATGQFTVRLTGTCDPGSCPSAAIVQVTATGSVAPAGQLATTTALP